MVDVGYDVTEFVAGQSVRFDLNLKNVSTETDKNFAYVWVRVVRDKTTFLATGIFHPVVGPTTMLYTFSGEGSYQLEVSYRNFDGTEIATATFQIVVSDTNRVDTLLVTNAFLLAFGGVGIGFALRLLWMRRNGQTPGSA